MKSNEDILLGLCQALKTLLAQFLHFHHRTDSVDDINQNTDEMEPFTGPVARVVSCNRPLGLCGYACVHVLLYIKYQQYCMTQTGGQCLSG